MFPFLCLVYSVEHALERDSTSVAPPEHTGHLPTASFLPPPPTISSSRARVDREPQIAHQYRDSANSTGSSDDDDEEEEEEEEEEDAPAPRFGPPRRCSLQQSPVSDNGNFLFIY